MELIENFNEVATKEKLKQLVQICNKKHQIDYNTIYSLFGCETDINYGYYQIELFDENSLFPFPIVYPQGIAGILRSYMDNLCKERYYNGNYFHIKVDNGINNERMIINIDTQYNALLLVKILLVNVSVLFSHIKFYAKSCLQKGTVLKCDKIVIYYNCDNRDHLYENICKIAKAYNMKFSNELSAFYHIGGDGSNAFPVGIGEEIPKTSFTSERANMALHLLTGVELNKIDVRKIYTTSKLEDCKNINTFYDKIIKDIHTLPIETL